MRKGVLASVFDWFVREAGCSAETSYESYRPQIEGYLRVAYKKDSTRKTQGR